MSYSDFRSMQHLNYSHRYIVYIHLFFGIPTAPCFKSSKAVTAQLAERFPCLQREPLKGFQRELTSNQYPDTSRYLGCGPLPVTYGDSLLKMYCNNSGGHCYWEGAALKRYHISYTVNIKVWIPFWLFTSFSVSWNMDLLDNVTELLCHSRIWPPFLFGVPYWVGIKAHGCLKPYAVVSTSWSNKSQIFTDCLMLNVLHSGKLTKLAGTWTRNEPIEHGDIPASYVSSPEGTLLIS